MRSCYDCNSQAIINKTVRIVQGFDKVYFSCKNPKCGARWVETISFKHTLCPSKLSKNSEFYSFVECLSLEQRQQLRDALDNKE